MKELEYLDHCLQRVEEKYNKSPHNDWTDGDFKKLARNIQNESGTIISTHTLKRLYGKIKYKEIHNPQEATKDALAKYIGYDSWDDYTKRYDPKAVSNSFIISSKVRSKSKPILFRKILLASILTLAIAVTFYKLFFYKSKKPVNAEFRVMNLEGEVPHTVTFNIDAEELESGNLVLNYGFTHPYLGREYVIAEQKDSAINYTYQIPGIYHPKLLSGQNIIDSFTVIVKSKGWVNFYHPEMDRHNYWLDNMYNFIPGKGYLSLIPEELTSYGKDISTVYYTSHRNIRSYGVNGENYMLETRLLNNTTTGGISCFDININILCQYSSFSMRIVEKNCQGYASLIFGEVNISGMYSDLSFLTRELNEWTLLRIEVQEKEFDLFMDNKKVYSGRFKNDMGEILGIEYRFKGSGKVDYLNLGDHDKGMVYMDEFGDEK